MVDVNALESLQQLPVRACATIAATPASDLAGPVPSQTTTALLLSIRLGNP